MSEHDDQADLSVTDDQQDGGENVISPEILEQIPQPACAMVRQIGRVSTSMSNPVSQKITSEHISAIINNQSKETQEEQKYRATNRWFHLG